MIRRFSTSCFLVALSSSLVSGAMDAPDFNREVRPILSDKCFFCHGPDAGSRKAKLRLDTPDGAKKVIDEKNLAASELLRRITTHDPEELMPPRDASTGKFLTPAEVDLLKRWVEAGAPYAKHWAFIPPSKPALPERPDGAGTNEIDAFLKVRLGKEKLDFGEPADREILIRRATLDLTGLPPTPAETDAFVGDTSALAYEKVIDRLLNSPRFGERMCLHWLDLARYGDSSAMHADGLRDMWPWRDWVIKAFNDNLPFDRFTVEQLAGDLLPDATLDQRIASGFNRNNVSSDEGGAIPEELRVEYAVDRVMTTAKVWLALSLECAQCHDHKYDPISQREYYQFFAYFNQASDPGMQNRNGNQAPLAEYRTAEFESMLADARRSLAEADQRLDQYRSKAGNAFNEWLEKQRTALAAKAPEPEPAGLVHYFPLDEVNGDKVISLSGRVASVSGNLQKADRGKGKHGLKFEGSTAFTCSDFPDYERDRSFTFASWVRLPKGGGGGAIFGRMDEGQEFRGYDFWVQGSNVGTHIIHKYPDNSLKVVSKAGLEENKWHLVAVTYDGSSKAAGVRIYIDGVLSENAVEQDSLRDTVKTSVPFKIGSRNSTSQFRGDLDDVRIYDRALPVEEIGRLATSDPVSALIATAPEQRTPEQQKLLLEHYLHKEDREYRKLGNQRDKVAKREAELASGKVTAMVMQDEPKMRATFVLNRGQYDQPLNSHEVKPGMPATLPPPSGEAPGNRLGMARWLVQPGHPLTARATVNRFWAMLFGEGIVKTIEDFGTQGDVPLHPELLDWLAVDFVEHGWDVKRCLKQMLMSRAYRQSSRAPASIYELDPENRFLARGPRFRLQAETLRDNALFLAGLLVEKIGGPSVKPYQPDGIWEDVALDTNLSKFVQDHGDKLYRRSMYTYWKRSAPAPTMTIFDAPTREKCTAHRPRTNTPLQALVTLNDPQFVEAARFFALRLIREGGADAANRIDYAYGLALSRHATPREIDLLGRLAEDQRQAFTSDPEKAKKFLVVGETKIDASLDPAELAAWTLVASTVLNLDEVLTRN
ncbi:MAG: DUF1553 domain-containing protein [Verrucomicrobiales bacterium]